MASPTVQQIIEAVPLIRSEAPVSEAAGQLTDPVVIAMREAGVFRMAMSGSSAARSSARWSRSKRSRHCRRRTARRDGAG